MYDNILLPGMFQNLQEMEDFYSTLHSGLKFCGELTAACVWQHSVPRDVYDWQEMGKFYCTSSMKCESGAKMIFDCLRISMVNTMLVALIFIAISFFCPVIFFWQAKVDHQKHVLTLLIFSCIVFTEVAMISVSLSNLTHFHH